MHIHLRIHHWVLWWFSIGIVFGVVAMVNIFTRNLTRTQDHTILLVGIIFWALGGVVSWASEGIQQHHWPPPPARAPARPSEQAHHRM
jgi:hypothetical protein